MAVNGDRSTGDAIEDDEKYNDYHCKYTLTHSLIHPNNWIGIRLKNI